MLVFYNYFRTKFILLILMSLNIHINRETNIHSILFHIHLKIYGLFSYIY